ncbi:MAG: hypothetical protein RL748_2407 [Pseudomonadota bacterium]|jgi:hypothetical protein
MIEAIKSLLDEKIESLVAELGQNGYRVCVAPSTADLPFPLGNYQPDLIAFKGEGGMMLAVKNSYRQISVDRFHEIALQIAAHHGWRFILLTLNDISEQIFPASQEQLPNWNSLSGKVKQISFLLNKHMLEPALVYLWSLVEAALRRRAFDECIPIERFPALNLLNQMYSCGEVSISEHEILKALLEQRNKVAHGLSLQLEVEHIKRPLQALTDLIGKWTN